MHWCVEDHCQHYGKVAPASVITTLFIVPRSHCPILHRCSIAFSMMPWDGPVLCICLPPFSTMLMAATDGYPPPLYWWHPAIHYIEIIEHQDSIEVWFALHSCPCALSWVAPGLCMLSGAHGALVVLSMFLSLLRVDPEASFDSNLT